jgi:hypothetical protein
MMTSTIKKGLYRHYKGKNYEVIDVARHSETQEVLVVYKALYETKFGEAPGTESPWGKEILWVRPLAMFSEHVNVDGKSVPRFLYVGEK